MQFHAMSLLLTILLHRSLVSYLQKLVMVILKSAHQLANKTLLSNLDGGLYLLKAKHGVDVEDGLFLGLSNSPRSFLSNHVVTEIN